MDALEKAMANTPVEKDLNHLMEGKTYNYVKCKHVDYTSERRETFQDLQLNVKGCKSVYD